LLTLLIIDLLLLDPKELSLDPLPDLIYTKEVFLGIPATILWFLFALLFAFAILLFRFLVRSLSSESALSSLASLA
jgi:hypothetical protein